MNVDINANPENFINNSQIESLLFKGKEQAQNKEIVLSIIEKAHFAKGLSLLEAATLLNLEDSDLLEKFYQVANEVKKRIYGYRIVLFAPLYISDFCVNNCVYCGYQKSNLSFTRRKLKQQEIKDEVRELLSLGHKRLAIEFGEHPKEAPLDYVLESIKSIYSADYNGLNIRRVNVNIAATSVEEYARLNGAGIGTYILFQETYNKEAYTKFHPSGPKSNFEYHLTAMHRARKAGIDDVGFGVLYGLYDWRFETLAMLTHAEILEKDTGVGPHTFSVPRIRPATGVSLDTFPYLVSNQDFKKVIAILRVTAPYAGLILSTRESAKFREELLKVGISQISAGSCTGVGGYTAKQGQSTPQFNVDDHRSPLEVVKDLTKSGYIPSYCTACYREGRTGDRFMELAKSGQIGNVCHPNALLTFKEFLLDYADAELKELGEKLIKQGLEEIPNPGVKARISKKLENLSQGERDLRE